jgi:hypothetical protein
MNSYTVLFRLNKQHLFFFGKVSTYGAYTFFSGNGRRILLGPFNTEWTGFVNGRKGNQFGNNKTRWLFYEIFILWAACSNKSPVKDWKRGGEPSLSAKYHFWKILFLGHFYEFSLLWTEIKIIES